MSTGRKILAGIMFGILMLVLVGALVFAISKIVDGAKKKEAGIPRDKFGCEIVLLPEGTIPRSAQARGMGQVDYFLEVDPTLEEPVVYYWASHDFLRTGKGFCQIVVSRPVSE